MIAYKDFTARSRQIAANLTHRGFINKALGGYEVKRDENISKFQNWGAARQAAADVKYETINHLDKYLEEFTAKIESRGVKVFWASQGQQVVRLRHLAGEGKRRAQDRQIQGDDERGNPPQPRPCARRITRWSRATLGEYIVELAGGGPYHFVFPAMHLTRGEISALFEKELGTQPTSDPEELTMIARKVLRNVYCTADIGISGANFAIAETGMISITENEGNARLTTSCRRSTSPSWASKNCCPSSATSPCSCPCSAPPGRARRSRVTTR